MIFQALVSGKFTQEDFSSTDVQPAELCSQPVPRRFPNKLLQSIFNSHYQDTKSDTGLDTVQQPHHLSLILREISAALKARPTSNYFSILSANARFVCPPCLDQGMY